MRFSGIRDRLKSNILGIVYDKTKTRGFISAILTVIVVGSLFYWRVNRDVIPSDVYISTGDEDLQYYDFGSKLALLLEDEVTSVIHVERSHGSGENLARLVGDKDSDKEWHFAILQGGPVDWKIC